MIKVLNLYAGIGGNRKYWDNVDVTAVEIEPKIAAIYQDFFPDDKVIITDAHQYLLEHYNEFDFIWSSPPCQSHSRARFWKSFKGDTKLLYPDMSLYQEIIFLIYYCKSKWVIENVKGYYEPLIEPQKIGRHYFWSNFVIPEFKHKKSEIHSGSIPIWQSQIGLYLDGKSVGQRKDQILRNCVEPELGLHILNCAFPENHKHIDNYYKQEILI